MKKMHIDKIYVALGIHEFGSQQDFENKGGRFLCYYLPSICK
jgi:hypothetical protein